MNTKGFEVIINANTITVFYKGERLFRVSANHQNAINLLEMLNRK